MLIRARRWSLGLVMLLLAACGSGGPASGSAGDDAATRPAAALPPLPFGDHLQRVLDGAIVASGGMGATAAVIVPGYQPWTAAAGASVRTESAVVPMRPDMVMEIGSVDKNLTAALMMLLVEDGAVPLDDPIDRWIADGRLDPDITIRHLLAHTGGIPDWVHHPDSPFQVSFDAVEWTREWTVTEMLDELGHEPLFPPGEGFAYSTGGYFLVRWIIEQELGMPLAEAVQARLLDPLGIDGAWLEPTWPLPSGVPVASQWYNAQGFDGVLTDITDIPMTAVCSLKPGCFYFSALDLAHWSQALFHDGAVVSEDSLTAMVDLKPRHDDTQPMLATYGLGVGSFNVPPLTEIDHYGHGGSGFGYQLAMLYLPRHEASAVVMVNDRISIETAAPAFYAAVDSALTSLGGAAAGTDRSAAPQLSPVEYVERMQTATDELERGGEQFIAGVRAATDPDTGDVVDDAAFRGLLDATASDLQEFFDELTALVPPAELQHDHNSFVAVALPRLEQWQNAAERAADIRSFGDLAVLTAKPPEFTVVCIALERAAADDGHRLDLDCD